MIITIGKTIVAAIVISVVSWLSGKKTVMAGFLTALPITSLLALGFSQMQWKDPSQSVAYAKSIFVAIPVSLLFFIPFLLAQKLNLSFWTCYCSGVILLGVGYYIHSVLLKAIL
ncbi:MAG: hypothetical protein N4A33_00440 [Bacteriovoracaceae bacterium]|jgi:hypothetical protein|nr:hypothetical protein [Bacteriovoracaceae bacterium]